MDQQTDRDLMQRVELIEQMLAEGRRTTQYWGWVFLLWGLGQITALAIVWMTGKPMLAWGTTMTACGVITGIGVGYARRRQVKITTVALAIGAVWWAIGISLCLVGFLGMFSHNFGPVAMHAMPVITLLLLGSANFTSGVILRWPLQLAIAIYFWVAATAMFYLPFKAVFWDYAIALLIGNVLFGLYLMVLESRQKRLGRRDS